MASRRGIAGTVVTLALSIAAGGALYCWWTVHERLPKVTGEITLAGLSAPVEVTRDKWGVPWIRGTTIDDAVMAQGYVMAQDRLWQMDLLRRVAGGELAEIFGGIALRPDTENRTLGLREAAERAAADADPRTREFLDAYARGVNAYIGETEKNGRLPIEFTLLQYQPRPWTPADTMLVGAYMWKSLTTTWKAKLNRAAITASAGPELAGDLFTVDSPLDHILVGGAAAMESSPMKKGARDSGAGARGSPYSVEDAAAMEKLWPRAQGFLAQFDEQVTDAIGSNNFVIGGAHTASGKPLLANDTHLSLAVPDIWYTIHVTAPGWNVAGFALPGAPLVIIGHNERIAWGFTNSNADVQDLYIEQFNPSDATEYKVNGNWARATVRQEIIHVKDGADVTLDVTVTRHGPVMLMQGERGYALRWTALEPGGLSLEHPLLGHAQSWEEFLEVMRHISGPGQNGIYADVDGNIGYVVAARVPVRKNGHGEVPVPGDTDDYEWTGYIPFDELPRLYNPPEGFIATANARITGPGYPWYLTDRWASPYRTARMYQMLEGRSGLTAADCNTVQNDIVSIPNQMLAAEIVAAEAQHTASDERLRKMVENLKNWDGRATTDSVSTSLVEFTRHELLKKLLARFRNVTETDYELWEPESQYDNVWWRYAVFLENVLSERPERWLPAGVGNYDQLIMESVLAAARQMRQQSGSPATKAWQWGQFHQLEMVHPVGRDGILESIFSIGPIPQDGTLQTVKAMGFDHGPAMRFVADLGNFDQSYMELSTGESGQLGSEHYRDQFDEWHAERAIVAPFSDATEERAAVEKLRLVPAAQRGAR